jgi:hypothetical protein
MNHDNNSSESNKISRRALLATATAAGATKFLPKIASSGSGRRILTLYFDKAAGALRAIEKLVP